MRLKLKHPYLSIKSLNTTDLPSFSVLIGRNGVGKTQLLDGIVQGHVEVPGISIAEIQKFDINTFQPGNSARVQWGNCVFAERSAERYLSGKPGDIPIQIAEEIFLDTLREYKIKDASDGRERFEEQYRSRIRQIPEFTYFPRLRDTAALDSYSTAILSKVITPLRSQRHNQRSSGARSNRTFGNDSAILLSMAMKLNGKLPHELTREDILRAAYDEGDTVANRLSQAFTRYKVEQYSWAHTQGEIGAGTIQSLVSEYRRKNKPPWEVLRNILGSLREASDDPQLFNFEFSDPENDAIAFADHRNYSFAAIFRNRTTDESYSLDSLSSGEKILMSFCLATFNQTMGQSQPKLLLFDELDALLHPSMISALIFGLKDLFVNNGTRVILATHSITTVSILEEKEIYRLVRHGGKIDIQPAMKSVAVQELSDGVATIDIGLKIIASRHSAPVTILTEGYNTLHLKKWTSLFFPHYVDVFEDLPARTGKDQLLAYGQFLAQVTANSHFLIVWDCDAKGKAKVLAEELSTTAGVTAFAFEKRENRIIMRGIENKYEEEVLRPYSNIILDAVTREEKNWSFDGGKKRDFAEYVYQHGTRDHFVHFDDLKMTVAKLLRNIGINAD